MSNGLEKLSDEELISKVRSENSDSMKSMQVLFERHKGLIYKISYSFLKNKVDVEDHIQDLFIRIYSKLSYFKGSDSNSFRNWMLVLTKNDAINKIRKKENKITSNYTELNFSELGFSNEESIERFLGFSDSPEEVIMKKHASKKVLEEFDNLNRMYSGNMGELLHGFYFEGKKYSELQKEFGIPIGTVKSRIFSAKKYLKSKLEDYNYLN